MLTRTCLDIRACLAGLLLLLASCNLAVAAEPLRVIALLPLTGGGASLGAFMKEGILMAKDDLHERHAGSLLIDLEVLDTKGSPVDAVSRLQAAIARQRPDAVIAALSPVARAIRPVIEEQGILTVITSTVLKNLARGSNHMVRVFANADDWTRPIARYANDHFDNLAIIHLQDDFGISILEAIRRDLAPGKTQIASINSFAMLQRDTRSLVMRVLQDNPDAVYVIGYGPGYINVLRALREADPQRPVLADSTFSDPAVLSALGDAADGVVFNGQAFNLSHPEDPVVQDFRARYAGRYGRLPYGPAALTYDALHAVIKAAQDGSGGFRRPTKRNLVALSPLQGVIGEVQIDQDGESSYPFMLIRR